MRIRARYLAPLLCGLAIIPIGLWHGSRQQSLDRLERWQQRDAIERTAELLDQQIDVPAGPMSLAALRALIEEQTELQVEFADFARWAKKYADDPAAAQWHVEFPGGRYSIELLLRSTLSQHDLTYDLDVDTIVVTAEHLSADSSLRYVETYPLPQPELASSSTDEESWANLLTSASGYENWWSTGGMGHIETAPGALVISQTARGHREIRRLLREFAKLGASPADFAPVPLRTVSDPEAEARLLKAMEEPASVDWFDRPLDEGLAELARTHNIPLIIRSNKLAEIGVEKTCPITRQLCDVSLGSLLRLMLSELESTYLFDQGALVVTTLEDVSENGLTLVAYPVHDLAGNRTEPDYDPLVELILTTVHPTSWDEVGGPASLLPGTVDGWLLVSQSLQAHERIEFVLEQLRRALRHDPSTRVHALHKDNPREQRIRAALDREIELQYDEMPLADAVRLLSDRLEIPIVMNTRRLEEAAVGPETLIRMRFPNRPARQQLNDALAELELTWLVDDEVLQITTPDDANSPDRLGTRLYDLRLLTDPDLGALSTDTLFEAVIGVVEPTTWDEVGGYGSLSPFDDILVVAQTREVHGQVERFLAALEQHCTRLPDRDSLLPWMVDPLADPRDEAIYQALQRPIDFAVQKTPSGEAIQRLAEEQNLPLVVRKQQMLNDAVDLQTEIDFAAEQMTVVGVLERLLEPLQATFLVQDGALIITSQYAAANCLRPRLYRIPEVRRRSGMPQSSFGFNLLRELPLDALSRKAGAHDPGTCVVLNEEWAAFSASEPLLRRIEMRLKPGSFARAAAEQKTLDEEREKTSDWLSIPDGYRPIAARPHAERPPPPRTLSRDEEENPE